MQVSSTLLDRSKPPVPGPLLKVHFPKIREERLTNGLPVFVVENHEQPIVSITLYLRTGSSTEPLGLEGRAAITTDLLTKGTAKRTALEIAESIDFIGGSLSASSSWDSTTISVAILTRFLETGLDLMADVALAPNFPSEELDRVKLQRISALQQAKADAGFLADTLFSKLLFPDHPYGHEASGTEDSIGRITTKEISEYYRESFTSDRAFIVVAGDVEPRLLLAMLETKFAGWGSSPIPAPVLRLPDELKKTQVGLVNKEAAVQSAIRVGHVGIARNNADYVALHVLNMLFGGNFNSRINLNLREKNGFTYGARSYFDARVVPGPFVISTEVRTEVTAAAVREIMNEFVRITTEEITADELAMVKNYVIGSFPLQLETPQQVASRVAGLVLYELSREYYDTFRDRVAELTAAELLRVAKLYLHPAATTIVVSGDVEALKGPMAEFGEVSVYDRDGALVKAF